MPCVGTPEAVLAGRTRRSAGLVKARQRTIAILVVYLVPRQANGSVRWGTLQFPSLSRIFDQVLT